MCTVTMDYVVYAFYLLLFGIYCVLLTKIISMWFRLGVHCQYSLNIIGHYFQYDGEVFVFVFCIIVAKVSSNNRTIGMVYMAKMMILEKYSLVFFATFSYF